MMRCNAIAPEHFLEEEVAQRKEVIEIFSIGQFDDLRRTYKRLDRVQDLVSQLLQNKPKLFLTLFFEEIKCVTCSQTLVFLEGFVLVNDC
jgi:hypothetical protein